ncbi:transcriptional activator protein CopR [Campylobacter sputorum subsp. bubulus]|uniref:Transcriptional activator protein CopR n=1 Tax=Campylobacter sputorum subsp. sputorum TaxID=32024 RepID=A0A381DGQ1_9BACT|nr:response regulator transcription factor [Campylobacter sputorum]ASM34910.1 two-component system response regulator [Campylobacter sputorum aubsp. sputorum RM3237]KAB0581960.1 response regulator transcription factor [Campylobacter sputorum subsp. sputorum]QEL05101.1 two-component system response regulator [Campylobacter sputorum subsp. sputorum]SUX09386.1 transcriptional activator protein CopR [Campylobacter sputorum subsp. sputorum]SUX30835.1 transcriptional activator protein CopR [Campylob
MKQLIAVIDDEEDIIDLLEYNLQKAGYEVVGFLNTTKVEKFLNEENVDLLIVDRNLKGIEGSDFVRELRAKNYTIPVIFLSAKTTNNEKLQGFDAGGDDYITKPFNIEELIARIKALLKRTSKNSKIYEHRDIFIDTQSREILIENKHIELTKLELNLLIELIKNKNVVLSRDYLLQTIWDGENTNDKTVNIAIKRLREKIDPNKNKNYIKSIRGEGYILC